MDTLNKFNTSAYQAIQYFNRTIFHKMGFKIVSPDQFTIHNNWGYRLLYFNRLYQQIGSISGDLVECGVYEGMSLIILGILNKESQQQRQIIGFDSFQGFPDSTDKDVYNTHGLFTQVTKKRAMANLHDAGFKDNEIQLVKGWFKDTLPYYTGTIALLHFDGDLYESTKCTLDNLWDKVNIGGIVAFDDYTDPQWLGEKKAVDEFMIEHPNQVLSLDTYAGYRYIIKRR